MFKSNAFKIAAAGLGVATMMASAPASAQSHGGHGGNYGGGNYGGGNYNHGGNYGHGGYDRERGGDNLLGWVAGGLLGAAVIDSLAGPSYYAQPQTYYAPPPPQTYYQDQSSNGWAPAQQYAPAPPPVYYAPPPVYYAPPPVYYAPPPVYYAPPPAYYYGPTVVIGYGRGYRHW